MELLLYQNLRAYTIIASLSLLDEHLYFHTRKGIMKKAMKTCAARLHSPRSTSTFFNVIIEHGLGSI
ncbi:hypothetical protein [Bacillus pumilus]